MKKISFVIPCYRSALTIGKVVEEIRESMSGLADRYSYEMILVNDFPADDTFEVIRKLAEEDPRITGVNLARNFGQHAALMAGLRHSGIESLRLAVIRYLPRIVPSNTLRFGNTCLMCLPLMERNCRMCPGWWRAFILRNTGM